MSASTLTDGWQPVPRSSEAFLAQVDAANTKAYSVSDIHVPNSDLAKKTMEYAKEKLPKPTFHHSMRVFYYGMILLKNHHPYNLQETPELVEAYFLSCMLHDIGAVPETLVSTRLSFELWGAMHSYEILPKFGASISQAELVAEVVNRHQDLGDTGMAPAVLGLVYFATIFDNVGLNGTLVDKATIESVTGAYPRLKWSGCFASTIRDEIGHKPWSHTTVIDRFAEDVQGNKLMEPYE